MSALRPGEIDERGLAKLYGVPWVPPIAVITTEAS